VAGRGRQRGGQRGVGVQHQLPRQGQ
jgi:hypothetical protein